MTIIKRIIKWIINLFKKLFGCIKKRRKRKTNSKPSLKKNIVNKAFLSVVLPTYMMLGSQEKNDLINNIKSIKKGLLQSYLKENDVEKIMQLLKNCNSDNTMNIYKYLTSQEIDKINAKKLDVLLNDIDSLTKEKIQEIIEDNQNRNKFINEAIKNFDAIIEYVRNNDVSFETKNLINNKLLDVKQNQDKNDFEHEICNKDFVNKVKNWDKAILDEVKLEYQKINYVTITTVMLDKIIFEYQRLEEDYQAHRHNKYYYERELSILKEQINYLRSIKKNNIVRMEIEKLKKELYTKSKDKYDILYNNEIFMDIDKKCDELLKSVNQKVVDIKKDKHDDEKKSEREKEKEEYLKKILKRFKDLHLSQKLIILHQGRQSEILDYENILLYVKEVYDEFLNGISEPFNYQRNRAKTELIKLYNDLNNVLSHVTKSNFLSIDHINFRMKDLIDAVIAKKEEVETELYIFHKVPNSTLVDEKIESFKNKFLIQNTNEKVLRKSD